MDIKTFDKSGELVRNKGQFKFIDPIESRTYESGVIYRADIDEGTWLHGQLKAGSFTRVDSDGNDTDIDGKPIKPAAGEDKPDDEAAAAAAKAKTNTAPKK